MSVTRRKSEGRPGGGSAVGVAASVVSISVAAGIVLGATLGRVGLPVPNIALDVLCLFAEIDDEVEIGMSTSFEGVAVGAEPVRV